MKMFAKDLLGIGLDFALTALGALAGVLAGGYIFSEVAKQLLLTPETINIFGFAAQTLGFIAGSTGGFKLARIIS